MFVAIAMLSIDNNRTKTVTYIVGHMPVDVDCDIWVNVYNLIPSICCSCEPTISLTRVTIDSKGIKLIRDDVQVTFNRTSQRMPVNRKPINIQ